MSKRNEVRNQAGVQIARAFKPETVWMGRLEKGADLITSLEAFCQAQGIQSGWINVLGALDRATLSYYDQHTHQYQHRALAGDYEIVSCMGNISMKEGKPFAHLHMVLSDTTYQTLGGHLWPGTVSVFAAEFTIFQLSEAMPLVRCADVETGLALW